MSKKVRVAIIGVGNCASSLVQGVEYYRNARPDEFVPGLMHVNLGGYHIGDIEFSAAFDIADTKVGKDLSEAIFAPPNNTYRFAHVPHLGVPVHRGMTHDGLGKFLSQKVRKAPGSTDDIVGILRATRTDVVVSYLPVGSEMATKWYVEQVLDAGCGVCELCPGVHCQSGVLAQTFRGTRVADHRRRHQESGRRDYHASRADGAVPRTWRAT
jgi:myo-inositol-1-phosphate synthase